MSCGKDKDEALEFARKMVETLREKLVDSAGVQSVSSDGLSVTYSAGVRGGMLEQLQYWEKQVQRLSSSGGSKTIDMTGGL